MLTWAKLNLYLTLTSRDYPNIIIIVLCIIINLSHDMRFPTMWYVRPAKPQISLRIRAVWSEPLLFA